MLVYITQECDHSYPFDNKSALVRVMAGQQIGDNPLLEPILDKVYDTLWHNQAITS